MASLILNYAGETAALAAAFFWAMAAILYRRLGIGMSPLVLNLHKGIVAGVLFFFTLALRGRLQVPIEAVGMTLLLLSGVIGIGCGDTFFFASLNRIGERRSILILETLAPVLATLIALVALREFLPPLGFLGILITLSGVAWVLSERTSGDDHRRLQLRSGIFLALAGGLCQALGSVLSRAAFLHTDIPPTWSALIRLIGGTLFLVVMIPVRHQRLFPKTLSSPKIWGSIVFATFVGTYLGILFQQISLKYTSAGVAQTLLGTSALFVLPFAILQGEKVTVRAALGAVVALLGVAFIFSLKS